MKNFLKGCLIFFLGGFFAVISLIVLSIVGIVALSKNISTTPSVDKNSYLVLNFGGNLVEHSVSDIDNILTDRINQMQLINYLKAIYKAADDPNICGIVINGDASLYSRAHVEEIRQALDKFTDSKKPIYAWFSNGTNTNYSLCLGADKIFMPKTNGASFTISGYNATVGYYKDTLDKIGVTAEVIHIGDYKGSGENYSRSTMSKELRGSYEKVFDNIHNDLLNDISQHRRIKKTVLQNNIALGKTTMMTPSQAKSLGLIDDFMSYDELKRNLCGNRKMVSIANYAQTIKEKTSLNKIAVIYAEGSIVQGESNIGGRHEPRIGNLTMAKNLAEINKDPSVKAVVLRINSPGGSALASELMLQELIYTHNKKPFYVSFGPMAASGGYYISCIPNIPVFTDKTTITGSIGVLSMLINIENLAKKIGVNFETVKKYKYDDIYSAMRPMTDEERNMMVKSMLGIYDEFTAHVSRARNIKSSKIPTIAQGRIWTGSQAVNNGLANRIGGLIDTIEYAAAEQNLSNYSLVSFPKPQSVFNTLLSETNLQLGKLNAPLKTDYFDRINKIYNQYILNGTGPCCYEPYIDAIK